MTRFVKIREDEMDGEAVSLALKRSDEGVVFGRVIATISGHTGDEPQACDAPVREAIREACTLARRAGQDTINIVDPDNLWEANWGKLEP